MEVATDRRTRAPASGRRWSGIRGAGAVPLPLAMAGCAAALLLALAGCATGAAEAEPGVVQAPPRVNLAQLARTDLARTAATGAVAVEVDASGVVELHAFGFTDTGESAPMPPGWRFHLGTLGDLLVAALALELEAAGELDLETPVGDQVPGLRPGVGAPTLAHLLLHTAGFDASPLAPYAPGTEPPALPPEEALSLLRDWVVLAPPGIFRSVSPHHVLLADHVLETSGGVPLADLVRARVPGAAGVEGGGSDRVPPGVRGGHQVSQSVEGPYRPAPLPDPALLPYRERFWATADVLAAFVSSLLRDPERLAALAWPRATTPEDGAGAEPWGLGFRKVRDADRWVIRGRAEGHTVLVHLLPGEGRAILILANGVGSPMDRVTEALLGRPSAGVDPLPEPVAALLAAPAPSLPVERVTQPDPRLAGTYRNGSEVFHLRAVGQGLVVDPGGAPPMALSPGPEGALEARIGDGRLAMTLHLFTDGEGEAWVAYGGLLFRREAQEEGR